MALSIPELYGAAIGAGFPPAQARTMAAVALGESGGNPQAYNGAGRDNSYGLWQINMIGSLGPARVQQFGLSSPGDLFDPSVNARAAYAIWDGDDANIAKNWSAANSPGFAANVAKVDAALGPAGGVMDSLASMFPAMPSLPSWSWSGFGGSVSEAVSEHQTELILGVAAVGVAWLVSSAFRR